MVLGRITLAVMPRSRTSAATFLISAISRAFETAYAVKFGGLRPAARDPTAMMRPRLAAIMGFNTGTIGDERHANVDVHHRIPGLVVRVGDGCAARESAHQMYQAIEWTMRQRLFDHPCCAFGRRQIRGDCVVILRRAPLAIHGDDIHTRFLKHVANRGAKPTRRARDDDGHLIPIVAF